MIELDHVSRYFGDVRAVDDVSFSVSRGEVVGLLGPNGAGKTTTLRMLTGYLQPDSGSVMVDGLNAMAHPEDVRQRMGYLPESAPIYSEMLVADYLNYVASMRGVESREPIDEAVDLCGIREVMHRPVDTLSKGYTQRVGLAQAILHDPEILILDEPTSGLDPNQIIEIRKLIREIGSRKTVILSTHILSEVEATCDRVVIINRGRIAADEETSALQRLGSGERQVTLSLQGPSYREAAEILEKSLEGVTVKESERKEHTSLVVSFDGSLDKRPDIYRIVKAQDWLLYEMHEEYQSLEDVFRELTGAEVSE